MSSLIARFMGPTWGPSGADRTQVGPMLAPRTLLSVLLYSFVIDGVCVLMVTTLHVCSVVDPMAVTVMTILVRCSVSCAACCSTTLSAECFPSYMRQTSVSWTNAFSSFFAIFAPLVGGPLVSKSHYSDGMMSEMASQLTGVLVVCSTVCSGADQRKHHSSASLAFERGIQRWPVNSPHKGAVTRKSVSIWWRHHG